MPDHRHVSLGRSTRNETGPQLLAGGSSLFSLKKLRYGYYSMASCCRIIKVIKLTIIMATDVYISQ